MPCLITACESSSPLNNDETLSFSSVGGLAKIIKELKTSVLLPIMHPDRFSMIPHSLRHLKGVLLYGPPGCGKTLLARALARESKMNFINLTCSSIFDKYVGESEKMLRGAFSLAEKIAPCIIFVDEMDSLTRDRKSDDHESTYSIKAEFLS